MYTGIDTHTQIHKTGMQTHSNTQAHRHTQTNIHTQTIIIYNSLIITLMFVFFHLHVVALSYNSAFFGAGTHLPILIDNLQCLGNESKITDCTFETHTVDCFHSEDAGIKCYPIDGEIRN